MSRRKKQYPIALEVKFAPLPKEKGQAYLYAMELLVGMLLRTPLSLTPLSLTPLSLTPLSLSTATSPQIDADGRVDLGGAWEGVERDGALMELG